MWQRIKRHYRLSLTYGIGDPTLTKQEKRRWIFFLWVLITGYSYYSVKDQIRSAEQGQWSLVEYLTGKPGPLKAVHDKIDADLERDIAELWDSLDSDAALQNLVEIQNRNRARFDDTDVPW